ncbi:hypothetical protein ACVI1J_004746 [Bradyrhizobium diazoefficiens]
MKDTCERLRKALAEQLKLASGRDLDALLSARGRELWIIGIDPKKRELVDVCGTIDPKLFDAKIRRTYANNDAGFMADAHLPLGITDAKADVFLLNLEHFEKPDDFLFPLIVHELAHYLDQIGEDPAASDADKNNAAAMLISLAPNVRDNPSHNHRWAQHLAVGARRLVSGCHSGHKTIKEFAEAAIPPYDRRPGWDISIKE